MIIQFCFVLNFMIFPCMDLILVIFQVFHGFQSLWEPCTKYIEETYTGDQFVLIY